MSRRTRALLSDGREILYFDDVDRARRPWPDERLLTARALQGELRTDPLTGEPVAIAAHRQTRTHLPDPAECPLCPGQEVPDPSFDVVAFENRWPSFTGTAEGSSLVAAGRCEVLVFTDAHDLRFADLPVSRVRTVVDAWADRTEALSGLPDVRHVACFENRGEQIGVTLHHPHGQVYGYPFVPPVVAQLVATARAEPGLYDRVLSEEGSGPRVVAEDDSWLSYVPYASRYPYELIVMAKRDVSHLEALDSSERDDLAALLPPLLRSFDRLFDAPCPYIAAWRQSPVSTHDIRLHLRVMSPQRAAGKLKYLAGSEAGYGAFISDVAPEQAADALRSGYA